MTFAAACFGMLLGASAWAGFLYLTHLVTIACHARREARVAGLQRRIGRYVRANRTP